MKWKTATRDFIFWEENDAFLVDLNYLLSIARWFPNFLPRKEPKKGFAKERYELLIKIEKEKDEEKRREHFFGILESLARQISEEGYSSILYPTIITEPNLILRGEKLPEEEEIWKNIYLIYCYSLKIGNYIITFDNIPEDSKKTFWRLLISEKITTQKVDLFPICRSLGISLRQEDKYFTALSIIAYWIKKFSESENNRKDSSQILWSDFFIKLGWSDLSSLIIFHREKKATYHVFPRFSRIVLKWLDADMSLLKFLNSLTNIKGVKEKALDLIRKEREKLIYYLFRYNEINGELLSSCVKLRVAYTLRSKNRKITGFNGAKKFFNILK